MAEGNPYLIPIAIIVASLFISMGLYFGLSSGKTGQATAVVGTGGATNNTGTGNQQTFPSLDSKQILSSISYAPYLGDSKAPISILEFADYQCPYCERSFSQTEPQILSNFVDTGKAKYYFLDFAFLGADSVTLSEGAWCANDQGKYYEYHDYVYSNQGQENSGWGAPDKVKAFVGNIKGIDTQTFNSCLDSKKYESRVTELHQLGADIGVTGTPSTLIIAPVSNVDATKLSALKSSSYGQNIDVYYDQSNGNVAVLIVGALPYDAFDQALSAMA